MSDPLSWNIRLLLQLAFSQSGSVTLKTRYRPAAADVDDKKPASCVLKLLIPTVFLPAQHVFVCRAIISIRRLFCAEVLRRERLGPEPKHKELRLLSRHRRRSWGIAGLLTRARHFHTLVSHYVRQCAPNAGAELSRYLLGKVILVKTLPLMRT